MELAPRDGWDETPDARMPAGLGGSGSCCVFDACCCMSRMTACPLRMGQADRETPDSHFGLSLHGARGHVPLCGSLERCFARCGVRAQLQLVHQGGHFHAEAYCAAYLESWLFPGNCRRTRRGEIRRDGIPAGTERFDPLSFIAAVAVEGPRPRDAHWLSACWNSTEVRAWGSGAAFAASRAARRRGGVGKDLHSCLSSSRRVIYVDC